MSKATFEIFDNDTKHYFRVRAANGEIVLQSEAYDSQSGAVAGMDSVRSNSELKNSCKVMPSADGQFYFTMSAKNGKTIGVSETYKTKESADRAVADVLSAVSSIPKPAVARKPKAKKPVAKKKPAAKKVAAAQPVPADIAGTKPIAAVKKAEAASRRKSRS